MREDGLIQLFAADLVGGQVVSVGVVEERETVLDSFSEVKFADLVLLDLRLSFGALSSKAELFGLEFVGVDGVGIEGIEQLLAGCIYAREGRFG